MLRPSHLGFVPLLAFFSACGLDQVSLLELNERAVATGGSGGEVPAVPATGGQSNSGGSVAMGGAQTGGMGGEPVAVSPPPPPPKALLVVDENPISTDTVIEQRLVDLGVEVSRISELNVTPADVEPFDLFVISPSADRVDTPPTLNDVAVPMIALEPTVLSKLGLSGGGGEATQDSVTVLDDTHPLAAGHTGSVVVCSDPVFIAGSDVTHPDARIIVATPNTNIATVFIFEEGTDVDGPLPAHRIGVTIPKTSACQTEAGWSFFDAAVRFVTES